MDEWERVEKERKLREQAEATIAFIKMILNELSEAKDIIRELCGTVRALNNPNIQLTDVNGFLQKAEAFINKE